MTALKPTVPAATNRALDPSAESNAAGIWGTNNGTLYPVTFDTVTYAAGTRAAKTVRTVTTPGNTIGSIFATPSAAANALRVLVTPGEVLSVGAYLRSDTAGNLRIQCQPRDAAGVNVGAAVASAALPMVTLNAWQWFVSEAVTMPALAAFVTVSLVYNRPSGNTIGGEQVWYDALMINTGAKAEPYFDGNTPGCSWSGTPHQSTSLRPIATAWTQWDGAAERNLTVAGRWNGAALAPVDLVDVTVV